MDKDLENWLYRPIYPEEEFFKKVEADDTLDAWSYLQEGLKPL